MMRKFSKTQKYEIYLEFFFPVMPFFIWKLHQFNKVNPRKKVVLRTYEGFMSGRAVGIILILLMFWNMFLNNYIWCLAQSPEKPFCYYSVLNKKCLKLIVKVNIRLNLLFVFPLALKTVLAKKTCLANLASRLRNLRLTRPQEQLIALRYV